uniref:Mannosyl-oligosaccharide glucosidase n=1 Tax=Physcomitrium patens TaxID=3218 RepID=A0A7I4A5H3_PHYPA
MQFVQFQGDYRERMFWGTYRSVLYLGIRARTPKSLLAGLMWLGVKDNRYSLRHTCEEGDKLTRYAWVRHDGATYGRQEIIDQGLAITTSFMKHEDPKSGYGGDWAVRVAVAEKKRHKEGEQIKTPRQVSLFFYIADEAGSSLKISGGNGKFAAGTANEVGGWELHVKNQETSSASFVGLRCKHTHNLTQLVWQVLEKQARTQGRIELPNAAEKSSNFAAIQVTGVAPLSFDVVFVSGTEKHTVEASERVKNLSGVNLTKRLTEREEMFEKRFQSTFHLQDKVKGEREVEVGRVALSNLLGSIGYFYGQSLIAIPPEYQDSETKDGDVWKYWPAALYTAVPSRSFFPRGFLWDEGFHQLLVSRWDRKMSKEIIAHWFDLLNIDGWIPREQILGDEARSKVPDAFVKQHTSNANPPALFMAIHKLATAFEIEKSLGLPNEEDRVFFERLYPRLEAWFRWFNTSQTGKETSSYYWHGRNAQTKRELNPTTLMSGLDDYPRASHPTDDERHLDLRCWMALAAQSLAKLASIVDAPNEVYVATAAQLTDLDLLNKLHYDAGSGRYLDYGLHTEKVELQRKNFVDPQTGFMQTEVERVVLKPPELGWVPHYGYNSLFPLLMGLLPLDSPMFANQMELLRNETNLWTTFGLRSLATTSSLYMKHNTEHDAPYWRGPVWMNINYLVLSALDHCSKVDGQHSSKCSETYSQLRAHLIRNVVKRYHESGYLWEQYDNANKGKGKGSHPFTGWTSLILLIMSDSY